MVALLAAVVSLAEANPDISERSGADHCSGVYIAADHLVGEGQTVVKCRGTVPGPASRDITVSDSALAVDGNDVEATWATPSDHTEWEVKINWQLRGQVRPIDHYTDADSSYWAYADCYVTLGDVTGHWSALDKFVNETAEIWEEGLYDKKDAIVNVSEKKRNLGTVSFWYEVDLYTHAELNRPEMSLECRGELFGAPASTEDGVHNAGWIRLIDTDSEEVLIEFTPFW